MVENRLVPWRRSAAPTALPTAMPNVFGSLQDEINRLFDDFWGPAPGNAETAAPALTRPRVDLSETAEAYRIAAEMPGLKEQDIDVTVADGVLTLKGEHKSESEKKEEHYHVRERSYGSFQRSFRLPPTADLEKISAKFENGVLNVVVPKLAEAKAQTRKIAIEKA